MRRATPERLQERLPPAIQPYPRLFALAVTHRSSARLPTGENAPHIGGRNDPAKTPVRPGTAYAVRVGVGAVSTAILGIALLGEPANAGRLVSLGLIVAGVICLKFASG